MSGYSLRVAKGGTKLRTAHDVPDSESRGSGALNSKIGADGFPILPDTPGVSIVAARGGTRLKSCSETMAGFAKTLSDQLHQPLADETKLEGKYDILVTWMNEPPTNSAVPDVSEWPPLEMALATQLGLILERRKVDVPIMIIQRIGRTPMVQ
ncbi:MAG: hypothetical protein JWN34_4298 [Bryobacterales bacterium]|nr:hypothetical protein [Bryobacterales bacterium]